MNHKERIKKILSILRETGYVNVKYLCSEIGYSKATINRDLNFMEKQNMVIRSYGGVELVSRQNTPLTFRYHKMKNEKIKLCKAASLLVKDGDTIFIDPSSTTEYMAYYLIDKKNITVITNNIAIVSYLSSYSSIKTICLGGEIVEPPSMLGGNQCIKNAMEYKADKFFFSSHSINLNGEIGSWGGGHNLLTHIMAQNSEKIIYMADHEKVNIKSKGVVMTLDSVNTIITDYKFDDSFKEKYSHIEFIET